MINKLKADADARTSQLRSLVEQIMGKQADTYGNANDIWSFLRSGNYTVDPATKAQAQADIALLAVRHLPPDASGLNGQRVVRAVGHAVPAVVAAPDGPRVVAGFAAQVAALQEQRQAAARPVHAGEGDDLTN